MKLNTCPGKVCLISVGQIWCMEAAAYLEHVLRWGCQMMDGKAIGRVKREDCWRMLRQSDLKIYGMELSSGKGYVIRVSLMIVNLFWSE